MNHCLLESESENDEDAVACLPKAINAVAGGLRWSGTAAGHATRLSSLCFGRHAQFANRVDKAGSLDPYP